MKKFYPPTLALLALVLVLVLAACGDNTQTSIPATTAAATAAKTTAAAATTAAATTAAATTAVATTAAATTAAATTAAATTAAATTAAATTAAATTAPATTAAKTTAVATTAAATTAAATTAAANSGASGSATPPAADLTEIKVDPAISNSVTASIPVNPKPEVRFYYSDDSQDKVAAFLDAGLTSGGYKFAFPGSTKPISSGDGTLGAYSKAGEPDFFFTTSNVPTTDAEIAKFIQSDSTKDVPLDIKQKFLDQVKGHKSLVVAFAGKGLVDTLFSSPGATGSSTPGATVAAAAAPTSTPPASDLTEIKTDPSIINAAVSKLNTGSKVDAKYYTSTDDQDKVAAALDTSLVASGYKFAIPGATGPSKTGDGSIAGFYTKEGAPDVFFAVQTVTEENVARTLGVDTFKDLPKDVTTQFGNQLKSQKSYAAIVVGTGLAKLILG